MGQAVGKEKVEERGYRRWGKRRKKIKSPRRSEYTEILGKRGHPRKGSNARNWRVQ